MQSRSRIDGLVAGFVRIITLKNDSSGWVSGHLALGSARMGGKVSYSELLVGVKTLLIIENGDLFWWLYSSNSVFFCKDDRK